MSSDSRARVVIEKIKPQIDCGAFPIKRVIGETVTVQAEIFTDGHDSLAAEVLYRKESASEWTRLPLSFVENDRWQATFTIEELGGYFYTVEAWIDHFQTWQKDIQKKFDAGQDIGVDMLIGVQYVEEAAKGADAEEQKRFAEFLAILKDDEDPERAVRAAGGAVLSQLMARYAERPFVVRFEKELAATGEREKALFSAWYEFFPRSAAFDAKKHGTFKDCEKLLPEIARMGFDVFYLPPIHPIGKVNRKGKNNSPKAGPGDFGSPWAIGSDEGGHKAIHPQLGSPADLERLIKKAEEHGIEMAIDLAYQCAPDHPYVKEHPEWFKWRPDGTVQYAENPPKKYQDVLPINFETENWKELWEELKSVVLYWIGNGIRIFRVDNPHTKPFSFWEWLIGDIKNEYPDIIFLSEAFTRPKIMYRLAKVGFTQSYTYFTWRNTKTEIAQYLTELTQTDVREYFRPNFWPNTPDILPEHLQYGGRPAFLMRLVLAATLSSNYGIYGPAFELIVQEALPGREEYLNSEKYEIKKWNWDAPGNLKDFIARINEIRRRNPALQSTGNLRFLETDNEFLLAYAKISADRLNVIIVVVNLDLHHVQSGWVSVPLAALDIDPHQAYMVQDLLSDDKFIWEGERNYVELNPRSSPAHVFSLKKRMKRETDFDYFL